jgi:plastocyanin
VRTHDQLRNQRRVSGVVTLIFFLLPFIFAGPLSVFAQHSQQTPSTRQTHVIIIRDLRFEPATLTVRVGDVIEWKNADIFPHTATDNSGGFDSGNIAAGKTWKLTLRAKSIHAYHCVFHPNMTGQLIVR